MIEEIREASMATGAVEAALTKGAIDAATKIPWYKLWVLYNGKKVCIYGPAYVGKSELYDYIKTGKLRPKESANEGTPYFVKSGATKLTYSGDRVSNELVLRYTQDSPGGTEVSVVIEDINRIKPNFIFLVFDASSPTHISGTRYGGAQSWFTEFANKCHEKNDMSTKVAHSTRGLSIIWNKCDKLSAKELNELDEVEESMKLLAAEKLQRALGVGRVHILFSRCCLIEGRAFPHDGPAQKSQHQEALDFMFARLK